jgi:hypothetical protein
MGIFSGWLRRTSKEKHQAGPSQNRAQATPSVRRRSLFSPLQLEQLKNRLAPAVISSFDAVQKILTVSSNAADTIVIGVDPTPQDVLINNNIHLTNTAPAAATAIQQIKVIGGPGASVIDLSQRTGTPFPNLTSFTVTGNSGQDTLRAPPGQVNNWFLTGQNQGNLGKVGVPGAVPVSGGTGYHVGDILSVLGCVVSWYAHGRVVC